MSASPAILSIAVPVTLDRGFSYAVPDSWPQIPKPGSRVLVPFANRYLIGIVRPVEPEMLDEQRLKPMGEVLDPYDTPALPKDVVTLCEWLQDYYAAPVGEVYRLALPGMLTGNDVRTLKLTAQAKKELVEEKLGTKSELRILEALRAAPGQQLPFTKLFSQKPRIAQLTDKIAELVRKNLCEIRWAEGQDYKTEVFYRRTAYLRNAPNSETVLGEILGRSKQKRALLDLLETNSEETWLSLGELRGPFPRAQVLLKSLVTAGLVAMEERPRELDPFALDSIEPSQPQAPTRDQSMVLDVLCKDVDQQHFQASLLHGITGSGKTEVYLQLIAHVRSKGGSAIVLVPEIALTPQLANRFRARFGDEVAVLHSGLTPSQRLNAWQQIRANQRPIVIGARSAVFAPVERLMAIIVDEEHDASFKQEEGVHYHARDVALVRARECQAVAVLGSATPSLESYEAARSGRYRWLRLVSRPTPRPLPKVELVPLSVHRPDPQTLLTARMRAALTETVASGEQALLFLNRRGFATTLICESCGALHPCPDCSTPSMTYHLQRNRLLCHLCGHMEVPPSHCKSCGSGELLHGSPGTERVELAIAKEISGARVMRLDRDTSRGKRLLETLEKFQRHEIDILVGTQMLSKGHDFPGVTFVGILQADHTLGLPDIRAAERTFQLLTQVAGRAGRGQKPGRVLVQAFAITHPAIKAVLHHDFEQFAHWELGQRELLGNPPFGFLALVRISGIEEKSVRQRAEELYRFFTQRVGQIMHQHQGETNVGIQILGPIPSPIERINRRLRWQILLRSHTRAPLRWLIKVARPLMGQIGSGERKTLAFFDVDPQTLM